MRRTPYTERGIRRLKCVRYALCGNRARTQWQVCADGRVYRPLCLSCDIELNRLVLEWALDPQAEEKVARYQEKMGR